MDATRDGTASRERVAQIRLEVEAARGRVVETVDAIGFKADLPARLADVLSAAASSFTARLFDRLQEGEAGTERDVSEPTETFEEPAPEPGADGDMHEGIGVTRFDRDDEGYERWIEGNPRGFVVNCEREPSTRYLVMHRGNCPHISAKGSNMEHWTHEYIKVCSERSGPLLRWCQEVAGGRPTTCGTCAPLGLG